MSKNKIMTIRLTDQEHELLLKAAKYSKLTTGAYVRMVVLQDAEKRVRFYEKVKSL